MSGLIFISHGLIHGTGIFKPALSRLSGQGAILIFSLIPDAVTLDACHLALPDFHGSLRQACI